MKCFHRTTEEAADLILEHGFDLSRFGAGAGSGSGEPAGIYVSPPGCEDFSQEIERRGLAMQTVLEVEFAPSRMLQWETEDRINRFKAARIDFLRQSYRLTDEEASAVASCKVRILKIRPDLEAISAHLSTREGERDLAMHFSKMLTAEGIDAVNYRDPWQKVEQIVILDPSIITGITLGTQKRPKFRP